MRLDVYVWDIFIQLVVIYVQSCCFSQMLKVLTYFQVVVVLISSETARRHARQSSI